jgi:hypothetical protein
MSCETETTNAQLLHSPKIWRYLRIVFVVLVVITLSQQFTPSVVYAYSCGNVGLGHCYGRVDWGGGPINGAAYDASVVHMSTGDGFVDNEMWVSDCDTYNPFCNPHWVETGYISPANGTEQYFWADFRPQDNNVTEHWLSTVGACDYGNYTHFDIHQTAGSNQFEIDIASCSYGFSGYSNDNAITLNDILVGSELAGSSGASASRAYFVHNQWIGSDNVYHYQNSNGAIHGDNPPSAGWNTDPQHSSTGGVLWTNCCS